LRRWPANQYAKICVLEETLTGHFTDEHAFLCQLKVERIDDLTAKVEQFSAPPAH
jgi:transposase